MTSAFCARLRTGAATRTGRAPPSPCAASTSGSLRGCGVGEPVVGVVGGVVGQHVEDEALLDRLPHRVQCGTARTVAVRPVDAAPNSLQRLGLRGRGEREERQVRAACPRSRRAGEQRVVGSARSSPRPARPRQRPQRRVTASPPPRTFFSSCHRLAGGRGVRLVDDHREPAARHRARAVLGDCTRELLQRGDDDPGRVARQRGLAAGWSSRRSCTIVPGVCSNPDDRVLQLPVQHPRSVITTTLSKTGWSSASPWQRVSSGSERVQAIVFDFPDPAECWTSRSTPGAVGSRRVERACGPRPTGGSAGTAPVPSSTCTNEPSRSSQASRCQTCSHRYAVS